MSFRLTVFTLCVFSLLIIHQTASQNLFCSTIPQCQLIINQLNQANQDLQTRLTGQSPSNATIREEPTEFPLPGDTSEFQNSFIPSEQIVNYNSYDVPATGTFYLQVKNLENGTSSVYLSSTCACNSTSSTSQPTSDENCMSSVAQNNYLIETASAACTVYYAINSPSEVSAATIWFYPLESLPVNTPTKINFPFPNFPRTFTYIFGPDNILATFYLSVTSIEPSTLTNIYITSDCDTACAEGDSFTKFPSQSQNCWVGTADGALTVFNFYVTRSCTFYYTLESPLIGNVTATMSAYKTEPLLNDTSTRLDFPLNGQYRTFVQDININEVFYISSYPFKTSTTTHVYITSNCTDTCADSTEYTNYPVMNQHCWDSQEKYYFVVSTFCRIYYSVYSSVSGQVAEITGTMYSLLNLPLGTVYGVDFPFAGAYRWFYTDVNPANLSQVLITGQKVDNRIDSRIFVSTNCTLNCFESLSYSHYPTYSNNCGAGTDEVLVPVNATAPCRIFYAVYSSASGLGVYVQTQDGSSS